jgi:hypothetical protein
VTKHTAYVEPVPSGKPAVKKSTRKKRASRKPFEQHDRLMAQLENAETALQQWIKSSPENAESFRRDPIRAMRAAGLDIDDDIMLELELITRAIARKLQ